MKLSRKIQFGAATGLIAALLAAIVGANARQSWRPVTVDLGLSSDSTEPQYLPMEWRGSDLHLLVGREGTVLDSGKAGPTPWRVARNWNRTPVPVIQKALRHNDILALSPANADFALSDGGGLTLPLQVRRRNTLNLLLKEHGHHNSAGTMEAGHPKLFSFSPDGAHLVSDSELNGYTDYHEIQADFCPLGLVLFDVKSGKQIARQSAHEGGFTDFAWSPDSKEVAAIAADGWVFILDGKSGKLRLNFRAHQLFGSQIAWAPDSKTLITATNPRLELSPTGLSFNLKSGEGIGLNYPSITATIGRGKGKRVIASDAKGDTTWNGRTERLLKRFDALTGKQIGASLPLQTGAVDMDFSPDGQQLALGEHEFTLILNAQTLATERRLEISTLPRASPHSVPHPVCVAWSQDSATLATSTSNGLTLWRMR